MKIDTSKFQTQKALHKFIFDNRDKIIAAKKSEIKEADNTFIGFYNSDTGKVDKSENNIADDATVLIVKAIINTTNIIDSHQDMHVSGIWSKSLKENHRRKHLQEHNRDLDKTISSGKDLTAYTIDTTFKALGVNLKGSTQALIYESTVRKARNPFMFDQYKNGWIEEHSVGMQYTKVLTAINDKEYTEEFKTYNKYYPMAANPEFADKNGFFFVVLESKEIEGSAVTFGSNPATPVYNIEQPKGTHKTEQPIGTQSTSLSQLFI